MLKEITVATRRRTHFVEITGEVAEAVRAFGLAEGSVVVYVPHTTAGVTINENADQDVTADMAAALERMVPWNGPHAHTEGNAAAHVKASLMGSSVTIPVREGRLCLGTWQGVFLAEFDGPRTRTVIIRGHQAQPWNPLPGE